MRFLKGHGTENDFVILPDHDNELDLTGDLVAALCERRSGIGGDGVLRVVRTKLVPEVAAQAGQAEWFMDYRNADGSVAEMCGNGTRVFVRYLLEADLVHPGALAIATRGGVKPVRVSPEGEIATDMGRPAVLGESLTTVGGVEYTGLRVDMGNPHLACVIGDPVTQLDLSHQPAFDPADFPNGVNIELVNAVGPRRVVMRVHERGAGETRSCGTGAVAAAVAAAHLAGERTGTWTVEVPGGMVEVTLDEHTSHLAGPAVIVASGDYVLA